MRLGDWPWRLIALLMLALFAGRPALATDISLQSCVARLNTVAADPEKAGNPSRFDCNIRQNRLGSGDFLTELRFDPVPVDPRDPLVLRTSSLWQEREIIRFHYGDGSSARLDMDSAGSSAYLTLGAVMEFPVPVRAAPLTRITIETRGAANLRGVVVGARLVPVSEAVKAKLAYTAIYAGFAGLALSLLIYNLSLWRALRNRFQLYYCLMVGALGAYAFTSSGAILLVAPWIANNERLRLNYVLLALCALTGVRFVRNFFEREVDDAWLDKAFRFMLVGSLASALAFALLSPWLIRLLDLAYFVTMTGALLLVFPVMALAWKRRAQHFGLFIAAWSAPLLISTLRAAYGFNLVPYSFWLDNGNLIAMAIEALLSSLLVTARVREVTEERDDARAGEKTARHLASTDPLTGLLNRRAFLDQAIGRRTQQALLLIDIDHFKSVNDRLGHEAGDQVLVAVAEAIRTSQPSRSLAVRLGGEEFALLIPRAEATRFSAETLLSTVRAMPMPQGIRVTVSIGLSEGQLGTEDDWKRLYRLADAALYRAKADGRDRFCKATDFRSAA